MRLTKRLDDGQAVMDCQNCELNSLQSCTALACRNRLKERLAEYEDVAIYPANLRPKGEWVEHDCYVCNSDGEPVARTGSVFVCSECGREVRFKEPFCHCGADMRGTDNG